MDGGVAGKTNAAKALVQPLDVSHPEIEQQTRTGKQEQNSVDMWKNRKWAVLRHFGAADPPHKTGLSILARKFCGLSQAIPPGYCNKICVASNLDRQNIPLLSDGYNTIG